MLLQPLTTAESCSDWSFFRTQEHKEMSIKSWQPRQVKLSYVRSKNQFSNFLIYKEVCWNFHSPMLSCSSVCLKLHQPEDATQVVHKCSIQKNHFCASLLKAAGQRDFKSFTHLISCAALVTLSVTVWLLPEPWHLLKAAVTLPIGLVERVCWNVRGLSKYVFKLKLKLFLFVLLDSSD